MVGIVTLVFVVGFLAWLLGVGKERPAPVPEDDIETPIDEAELEAAERELAEAEEGAPLDDSGEDDDDWGPGTGRSSLPGIL